MRLHLLILFSSALLAGSAANGFGQVHPASVPGAERPNGLEPVRQSPQPRTTLYSLAAPESVVRLSAPSPGSVIPENLPSSRRRVAGITRQLPAGSTSKGQWENTPSGERIWRMAVTSEGAKAVRIHLTGFDAGDGKVWLVSPDRSSFVGPYSGKGIIGDGDFWTGAIAGETVIIEYLPATSDSGAAVPFQVAALSHRFATLSEQPDQPLRSSGSIGPLPATSPVQSRLGPLAKSDTDRSAAYCQLDVSCYSAWSQPARAVAQIDFIDGAYSYICTAYLVNTRSSSYIPYLLTNDHCVSNQTIANTVYAYWNYQTAYCGAPAPAAPAPQTAGTDYLYGSPEPFGSNSIDSSHLDMAFLRLRGSAPGTAYYLGWNTTRAGSGSQMTVIGHPGDNFGNEYKRIAFGQLLSGSNTPEFEVAMTSGLTEAGYSGSPWFTSDGKAAGLHSAGTASAYSNPCTAPIRAYGAWFADIYPLISPWLDDCTYQVSPLSIPFGSANGNGTISVTTSGGCGWTAASNVGWIQITAGSSGTGNGSVSYHVDANPAASPRSGTLTVAGKTVTINQAAGTIPCSYAVNPSTVNALSAGQTGTITVTAGTGCSWAATPGQPWVTITNGSPGSGNGTVGYSIASNPQFTSRSTTVTIGGQVVTINQAAAAANCVTAINPGATTIDSAGGTRAFYGTAPAECTWSLKPSCGWLTASTSRSGNGSVAVSIPANPSLAQRSCQLNIGGQIANLTQAGTQPSNPPTPQPITGSFRFVPTSPCRIMDTRAEYGMMGPYGPPSFQDRETRTIPIPGQCGIPATAKAYSMNVTVVPIGTLAYLSIWPTGQLQPMVSTLNNWHKGIVANAAVVPAGTNGAIDLFVTDPTDVIIDINGYFDSPSNANALDFYTLTPCRAADTRLANGLLGGPVMEALQSRSFPVLSSQCQVPGSARAYSLNATVVPQPALAYLTLWPSGQNQPMVSTLNANDGSIVANAAIVPAGSNGAISAFTTNRTHLLFDLNGYFALPSSGSLKFYPVTPCRAADTRVGEKPIMGAGSTREFTVAGKCGIPAGAAAYSMNVTVLPTAFLGYLTIWPAGQTQPLVSTLNAPFKRVLANAAIVPAGNNGRVTVFVTNQTEVILDINGYFAP